MSQLTHQWYHYSKNPITGKYEVWNNLGDHIGTYDSELEAKSIVHDMAWDYELRYRDAQKAGIQDRKAALEQAGWKIFVQSDDNRDISWIQGFAITPDGFKATTKTYLESENVSEEMILEEIVNKAWAHFKGVQSDEI